MTNFSRLASAGGAGPGVAGGGTRQFLMTIIFTVVLFSLLAGFARGGELEELREVQAERRKILAGIVNVAERRFETGEADQLVLLDARIRLARFDRNHAGGVDEKMEIQKKIVELQKSRFSIFEKRYKDGSGGSLEFSQARERYLAARERLIKLELAESDPAGQE